MFKNKIRFGISYHSILGSRFLRVGKASVYFNIEFEYLLGKLRLDFKARRKRPSVRLVC